MLFSENIEEELLERQHSLQPGNTEGKLSHWDRIKSSVIEDYRHGTDHAFNSVILS